MKVIYETDALGVIVESTNSEGLVRFPVIDEQVTFQIQTEGWKALEPVTVWLGDSDPLSFHLVRDEAFEDSDRQPNVPGCERYALHLPVSMTNSGY
ncbi:hypothetical protein A3A70_03255 [candidate division WWE3 bacterium RIFCSPLOWO2_01_FULL_42_11]|uniref:Uncharacterized protein n=1 Tax=candidate division WWE3 bacterium RIFCSPLOWO2_01_FULL_42_11 TaxID=1802627 RepID=A0A1F4VN94_UNCKA|nr:MAG: hypothetical protein A3A70_03255 [candidate division WWE3 bacterium RIFCSPLOWO2_01_FULL_42_11]